MILGLLFLVGYNDEDCRPVHTRAMEAARIRQTTTELDGEYDFHRISVVVSLILGPLMIVGGVWRRHRNRELKRQMEEIWEVGS